jgi:hypothetical protein
MKRGNPSKLRQARYSSSAGQLMVTERVTLTPVPAATPAKRL